MPQVVQESPTDESTTDRITTDRITADRLADDRVAADGPTAVGSTTRHGPHAANACGGCLDRRQVLQRAGLVTMGVAAAGVLAACSTGDDSGGGSGGSEGGGGGGSAPAADGSLAQLADIPVGGAISATDLDGNKILLVQPEAGTVVGLSAVCTHQGCTVVPEDDGLLCPCHGSVFDLDGTNVSGPAPEPLPTVDVHVADGAVLLGKA